MTFGHSPSLIRKVLGIDPKNVIHRACVYNVGLHNDNVPKHLALHDYRRRFSEPRTLPIIGHCLFLSKNRMVTTANMIHISKVALNQ